LAALLKATSQPMTRLIKLDNVDHADLRVAILYGAANGDAVNQVLVFPTEFEQLQREFPIIFRRDERSGFYAVALLGLDMDENLFLGEGGWTTRYVPAVQQRGPFHLRDGAIHVDLDDPRVGGDVGEPLYLQHGGDAPYLRHVSAVLDAIRAGAEATGHFFAALDEAGLIRPVSLNVEVGEGTSYTIADVFTVDEEKLAALDGGTLERLNRAGFLRAATMAAASLAGIARLIELKTRKLAAT
jgi:hypothetical protein